MLALLECVMKQGGVTEELLRPHAEAMLKEMVLPNAVWRAGLVAATIRKVKVLHLLCGAGVLCCGVGRGLTWSSTRRRLFCHLGLLFSVPVFFVGPLIQLETQKKTSLQVAIAVLYTALRGTKIGVEALYASAEQV